MALARMEEAAKRRETTGELYARLEAEGKQLKRQRLHAFGGTPDASGAQHGNLDSARSGGSPEFSSYPEPLDVAPHDELGRSEPSESQTTDIHTAIADGLPPGWHAATDPATGVIYFYNDESGCSQWSRPDSE